MFGWNYWGPTPRSPGPAAVLWLVMAALLPALLAGCATPQRFRSDVAQFATAIDNAAAAYREQGQQLQAYRTEVELRRLLRERPALLDGPESGDCTRMEARWKNKADTEWSKNGGIDAAEFRRNAEDLLRNCQIFAEYGDRAERIGIDSGDLSPQHTRLMEALVAYAHGLTELVDSADDRKAFEEAASGTRNDFLELLAAARNVGATSTENGGTVRPLAIDSELTAISSLLIEATGAALENRRRQALARIVETMQPAVEEAAERMAAIMRFRHLTALSKTMIAFSATLDQSTLEGARQSQQLYAEILNRAVAGREAIAFAARADPGAVFESMAAAHLDIANRIHEPDTRFNELAGSLEDFLDTSRRGLDAIRQLRTRLDGEVTS